VSVASGANDRPCERVSVSVNASAADMYPSLAVLVAQILSHDSYHFDVEARILSCDTAAVVSVNGFANERTSVVGRARYEAPGGASGSGSGLEDRIIRLLEWHHPVDRRPYVKRPCVLSLNQHIPQQPFLYFDPIFRRGGGQFC